MNLSFFFKQLWYQKSSEDKGGNKKQGKCEIKVCMKTCKFTSKHRRWCRHIHPERCISLSAVQAVSELSDRLTGEWHIVDKRSPQKKMQLSRSKNLTFVWPKRRHKALREGIDLSHRSTAVVSPKPVHSKGHLSKPQNLTGRQHELTLTVWGSLWRAEVSETHTKD